MRTILIVLTAAATVAAAATPAAADRGRRHWRGHYIGAISRNVITPYYVGYYPGHYSYYRPDPVYFRPWVADPDYDCWRWPYYGYRFKVC